MENKKWRTFIKEIISGIQFFLISYMVAMGFTFTYMFICFVIDSLESWTIVACAIAGLLSMGGLFTWIVKSNTNKR
jgi:predicted branched-subunit amino acid permease